MNITPWPTNTSSSMVTPSHTKVCDEILQRRPIDRVLLDLDERADLRAGADAAAVEVDEVGMKDDHAFLEDHVWRYWHVRRHCSPVILVCRRPDSRRPVTPRRSSARTIERRERGGLDQRAGVTRDEQVRRNQAIVVVERDGGRRRGTAPATPGRRRCRERRASARSAPPARPGCRARSCGDPDAVTPARPLRSKSRCSSMPKS